jgi:hypothetical protein
MLSRARPRISGGLERKKGNIVDVGIARHEGPVIAKLGQKEIIPCTGNLGTRRQDCPGAITQDNNLKGTPTSAGGLPHQLPETPARSGLEVFLHKESTCFKPQRSVPPSQSMQQAIQNCGKAVQICPLELKGSQLASNPTSATESSCGSLGADHRYPKGEHQPQLVITNPPRSPRKLPLHLGIVPDLPPRVFLNPRLQRDTNPLGGTLRPV